MTVVDTLSGFVLMSIWERLSLQMFGWKVDWFQLYA